MQVSRLLTRSLVSPLYRAPMTIVRPVGGQAHPASKEEMAPEVIPKFTRDFSQPTTVPETAFKRVCELMETGRLFRYCAKTPEESDAAVAERNVANFVGHKYAIGTNSCSSAIFLSLLCAGVKPGDEVLTNSFTFTALPSTICNAQAKPVLVEANWDFTMNVDDLVKKIDSSSAKVLLLSHFRGRVSDIDTIERICEEKGILMIEDCAHGMGATWNGRPAGHRGKMAVYSVQSDKVINAGEGGFLTTDNEEWAAKAIHYSGSYEMLWKQHLAGPSQEVMERTINYHRNCSIRMTNTAGAMVNAQLPLLPERVANWNSNMDTLRAALSSVSDVLHIPNDLPQCVGCWDHLVFNTPSFDEKQRDEFVKYAGALGVVLKPFGTPINARFFKNWKFMGEVPEMPRTEEIVRHSFDMKCPFNFTTEDMQHVGKILVAAIHHAKTV